MTRICSFATRRGTLISVAAAMCLLLAGCMSPDGTDTAAQRRSVQDMRAKTMTRLDEVHPGACERIAKAAGHAVFSNVNVNLILLSAGGGWGVARDKATGKDTYMRMASGGIGLGLGVKDFRGVFVFDTKERLDWFVNEGWDASGQADAAAKASDKGGAWAGAVDVAPGVHLYQITENGLALQATIQGTKFWKDSELN
jgi:lipid-binding SYLF domain-containing protein